ncbi:hypothetical protein KP509_11G030300 [Ceratopteris richardii]|nr:hypothetical protein KP509_11G030300 [Ceratopteris richardii]
MLHTYAIKTGFLESDRFISNTLINMYMKFGSLVEARVVFNSLPVHDVVSWNILLSGFIKHNQSEEVLSFFKLMQSKNVSPNLVTFLSILKACGLAMAMTEGQEIHAELARRGLLERNIAVGNALIDMYVKCSSLGKAGEVFNKLRSRDVISGNTLMVGYAKYEYAREALDLFERMQLEGIFPDAVSAVSVLKVSSIVGAVFMGLKIHLWISVNGLLDRDLVVVNALLDMYVTFGCFGAGEQLFNKMLIRNVVSWTSLIAGYTKHNHAGDALFCFEQMQNEGVFPNAATYVCALNACGSGEHIAKGQEIHVKASFLGLLEKNTFISNAILDMYAKCGRLGKALNVFDRMLCKDIGSWNALINGYAQRGHAREALDCLKRMQAAGVPWDAVTLVCGLKACTYMGDIAEAAKLETEVFRKGHVDDSIVMNSLISFHTECGAYFKAQDLFNRLPRLDVASWTTLMASYMKRAKGVDALQCLDEMQVKGVHPDALTFACSLKTCSLLGDLDTGKRIHAEIEEAGMLEDNNFLCSALVDMYFKCGWAAGAQQLFDKLQLRDVVTWTAMLAGYGDHDDQCVEALKFIEQMYHERISLDSVAYICGLALCGITGAIGKGMHIHVELASRGLLQTCEPFIANALVNMYAKLGLLTHAQEVFNDMPVRDSNSWNFLLSGYAHQGSFENVFHILRLMRAEGESPNLFTFTNLLKACNQSGLVEKAKSIFEETTMEYGVIPSLKHHMCMIDLLNRAGYMDMGAAMIVNLPTHADVAVWQNALNACKKLGHTCFGNTAFEHISRN